MKWEQRHIAHLYKLGGKIRNVLRNFNTIDNFEQENKQIKDEELMKIKTLHLSYKNTKQC